MIIFISITLFILLTYGDNFWGSTRWLPVGFVSIQPSEVAKPIILIWVANHLSKVELDNNNLKTIWRALFMPGIAVVLIFMQPDYGMAATIAFIILIQLLFSKVNIIYPIILAILGLFGGWYFLSIAAYRQLSKVCDYPLHLGITEAGSFVSGSIKSSIGLGSLLMDGIGDTIRISLSDNPTKEVTIGNEILKSLNLRNRGVKIISCPSCARQAFQVIDTVKILEEKLSHIKAPITLSIIGCVVNGPGEASQTEMVLLVAVKTVTCYILMESKTKKLEMTKLYPK